ncbi:MAG: glyoxalase/bleomycin resistance/extradiol dioxygenase family protein [Alphaproteobacteria bacterium]|nr:MAG: glyoxalase/bleomycin resistance/extradiol dioxygenase family protein [Alphaproteobacteria bacterium]
MQLNHVTVPADDYDASLAFYTALGLVQIVAAPPRYARFEMPGADTAGATLSFEVTPGHRAGDAEIFLHCDDVDADHAAAVARGVVFDAPPQDRDYLWRRTETRDPAGNRIVLYHAGRNQRFPPWRIDGRTGD